MLDLLKLKKQALELDLKNQEAELAATKAKLAVMDDLIAEEEEAEEEAAEEAAEEEDEFEV